MNKCLWYGSAAVEISVIVVPCTPFVTVVCIICLLDYLLLNLCPRVRFPLLGYSVIYYMAMWLFELFRHYYTLNKE